MKGTVTVDSNDNKVTNVYDEKEVSTKITVKPHICDSKNIYLELELNISNVINNVDDVVTVSKKYIKQFFYLPFNEPLILTGINKKNYKK